MTTADAPTTDLRPLRAHCTGRVVVRGEKAWEEALAAWGLEAAAGAGVEPAAVVYPADAFDEATIAAFAGWAGLRVAREDDDSDLEDLHDAVLVSAPERLRFRRPTV